MIKRSFDQLLTFVVAVAAIFVGVIVILMVIAKYILFIAIVLGSVVLAFLVYRILRRLYQRRSF